MASPRIIFAALVGALIWGLSAPCQSKPAAESTSATTGEQNPMTFSISSTDIRVAHRSIEVGAEYERFTAALEKILGRFSRDVETDMAKDPKLAAERIKAMEGEQGLMIFLTLNHGAALAMAGGARRGKQYLIGNPLTAIQMSRHDFRAALYAPLRVLVYEKTKGRTTVEYDQPSTLFDQFGNPEVTEVGVSLDHKLENALKRAAELSR